ncbi:glycosyltransferase [Proteobacteria bacterium 005FR1]|nr:glycosyltransferase [Proteobacteria bacterium 005FR1]
MSARPALAVIIPALNEAENLPRLLRQLRAQRGVELDIIVVDGGSSDKSAEIAEGEGARVIKSERGRGRQMNRGAAVATSDYLLFLHADSSVDSADLLHTGLSACQRQQASSAVPVAGHFPLVFADAGGKWPAMYRYMEAKSASNRRHTINGDQGLLIRKDFFDELGGFDESFAWMEDQDIAARIADRGRWILLPGKLATSARRFESEGLLRRYLLMAIMMVCYWTDNRTFFERARGLYPNQADARRLRLWPFLQLLLGSLHENGIRSALVQLYRIGRYARENTWQPFFVLDVLLSANSNSIAGRFTRFHDRLLQPLLSNPAGNAFVALLVVVAFATCVVPLALITDPPEAVPDEDLASDNSQ